MSMRSSPKICTLTYYYWVTGLKPWPTFEWHEFVACSLLWPERFFFGCSDIPSGGYEGLCCMCTARTVHKCKPPVPIITLLSICIIQRNPPIIIMPRNSHNENTRTSQRNDLIMPKCKKDLGLRTFRSSATCLWNMELNHLWEIRFHGSSLWKISKEKWHWKTLFIWTVLLLLIY